jgi:hypothetical protein
MYPMMRTTALILLLVTTSRYAAGGVILQEAYAQSGTYENGSFIIGKAAFETADAPLVQGSSTVDFPSLTNKATTTFTYRNDGDTASFELNWNFSINGQVHTEGYGYAYGTFFVTTDTHYTLSHSISSTGGADWYRAIELWNDQSGDLYLFENGRNPYLGDPDYGNFKSVAGGSPQGTLMGGKFYSILTLFDLHAFADVGASKGFGNLIFTMQDASVASVPEPSSLWVWGLLGMLVCVLRVNCFTVAQTQREFRRVFDRSCRRLLR